MSWLGLIFAAGYVAFAVYVVAMDRRPGGGGGWISLRGMSTYIVTMPVSAPFELMGAKLDYRKNAHMLVAVGGCALLAYAVGFGLDWVLGQMLGR